MLRSAEGVELISLERNVRLFKMRDCNCGVSYMEIDDLQNLTRGKRLLYKGTLGTYIL